jgi:hypothetical protein
MTTIEHVTDTTETTDAARDYTCKHCGETGLTIAALMTHGRHWKRSGQCTPAPEAEQPASDEPPVAGPATEEQISDYARALAGRTFIHRSTNWTSVHGAERIARLVLENGMGLDAAAQQVLPGFAGWPEGGAR